jgi:hypothetical protein
MFEASKRTVRRDLGKVCGKYRKIPCKKLHPATTHCNDQEILAGIRFPAGQDADKNGMARARSPGACDLFLPSRRRATSSHRRAS